MAESQQYIVSARKYRPATFASVVGQKALTQTLKNAIGSRRLAQAYLFTGPRGVGKTSCARIFAKTINCLNPTSDGEACGKCESCRAVDEGNSFNIIELDAASNNSVDNIRSLTEQVKIAPQVGAYRVFIIDEVHMLSAAAFNAFLKTLEEPPSYVIFILATTEKQKVIPTILSRCQIYDFKRITIDDMVDHLEYVASQEGITAEREALAVIALKADGAMRDALSIFDQVAASSAGNITYRAALDSLNVLDYDYYFRIIDAARQGDVSATLLIYNEIREKGFDSLFFVNGLAAHVRDLMVAADPRSVGLLETSREIEKRYVEQAATLPVEWYYTALKILNDCDVQYRTTSGKRLLVELSLIRLCQLLKPATPPFDMADRKVELRDPAAGQRSCLLPDGSTRPASRKGEPIAAQPAAATPVATQPKPTAGAVPPVAAESSPAYIRQAQAPSAPVAAQVSAAQPDGQHRGMRLKVHTVKLAQDAVDASRASSLERRRSPFSDDAFMSAWNEFVASNPSLHILVNAMRTSRPVRESEESFRIVVAHPAQQQAFELSMSRLVGFLRQRLDNDFLTLHTELARDEASGRELPAREFLKNVVEKNEALGAFLRDFDAELC